MQRQLARAKSEPARKLSYGNDTIVYHLKAPEMAADCAYSTSVLAYNSSYIHHSMNMLFLHHLHFGGGWKAKSKRPSCGEKRKGRLRSRPLTLRRAIFPLVSGTFPSVSTRTSNRAYHGVINQQDQTGRMRRSPGVGQIPARS